MLKATRIRPALIALMLVTAIGLAPRVLADTHVQPDSYFGIGGNWSTGSKVFQFAYSTQNPVVGYYLNWNSTSWASVTDYGGAGYGTHNEQTTPASSSAVAYFTNDGNLLLLDGSTVRWETYTGGNYGGYFDLQDDGNIVVRNSGGSPLWSIF